MTERLESALAPDKAVSLVGLSAAEFAATHDESFRGYLLTSLAKKDEFGVIELVKRHGWWSALDLVIENLSLSDNALHVMLYFLRAELSKHPKIVAEFAKKIPEQLAQSAQFVDARSCVPIIWQALAQSLELLSTESMLSLLKAALKEQVVSPQAASELLIRSATALRMNNEGGNVGHEESIWQIIRSLVEVLPVLESRRLFDTYLNPESIANSSSAFDEERPGGGFVFHGSPLIYECGRIVASKMSKTAGLAWTTRILVESLSRAYEKWGLTYQGREVMGQGHSMMGNRFFYEDIGWLIKVIVPLVQGQLQTLSASKLRAQLSRTAFSVLHPTFRSRAIILAMAPESLAENRSELVEAATIKGGLPSLSATIARRAKDSMPLAEALIRDRLVRYGQLSSPDESALLHMLIKQKVAGAQELALTAVRNEHFAEQEHYFLGFFSQLDWASENPDFALELLEEALRCGYAPEFMDEQYLSRIILETLKRPELQGQIFDNPALTNVIPSAISGDPILYGKYAHQLFASANRSNKIDLLMKVEKQPLAVALSILELAVVDEDPTPDSDLELREDFNQITGVRTSAYFALHQLYARFGLEAFHGAQFDVVELVSREVAPYGAYYGSIALWALAGAARRVEDWNLLGRVIQALIGLVERVHNGHLDNHVAGIIANYLYRLLPEEKEWFWARFSATNQAGTASIDIALSEESDEALTRVRTLYANGDESLKNHMAWYLWRRVEDSGEPDCFIGPTVQRLVDMFVEYPSKDGFASLSRLFCSAALREPTLALERLLKLCQISVERGFFLPVYFQSPVDLAVAPALKAVQLGEALTADNAIDQHYPILEFVTAVLCEVTDSQFTARIQSIFDGLPKSPLAAQRYQQWRERLAQ